MNYGNLKIKDHNLIIGGVAAKELADKYGTPLYCFDVDYCLQVALGYVETLKKEYQNSLVCFASKAFCCSGIYELLAPLGLGADVVSGGELYTALLGGMDPKKIYFHGNNKSEAEIKYALENDVGCFVVDGERELELINKLAKKPQNVIVRVNPGVEAHTHKFIQTALVDSKFGFSIADGTATEVIKSISNYKNVTFCGLSCHIGSQIFEVAAFEKAIDVMTDFIIELNKCGIEVERLDLGGGFGIKYTGSDSPLQPKEYMTKTAKYLNAAVNEKGIKPPTLVVEPGRSIVGEAGVTLYTVGAIKTIKNVKTYASVDGGMFENPRVSLYDAKYVAFVADKADLKPQKKYSIAGCCCESGDILIKDIMLPELSAGDILAVPATGAYHYSMASHYNRRQVPPVVAVKNGKSCYMVSPESYADIASHDRKLEL